jgi:predicted nucleotidyltransferase
VVVEAARLLYERHYKEYFQAKREAARRLDCKVLPTNQEIHQQMLRIAEATEGAGRTQRLKAMRQAALAVMELLSPYHPRLIGSVWTGHIRAGSDIDLQLYADDLQPIISTLESNSMAHEVRRVRSKVEQREREFIHIRHPHASGFEIEMTVYPESEQAHHPTCSITGGPMARASLSQLREALAHDDTDPHVSPVSTSTDLEVQGLLAPTVQVDSLLGLIPELAVCRGVSQNDHHHLDVYEHTIEVVNTLARLEPNNFSPFEGLAEPLRRHFLQSGPGGWERRHLMLLAALMHDLGKPTTRSLGKSGRIRFPGHQQVGARMARQIAHRLGINKPAAVALEKLVARHMEPVLWPLRADARSSLYRLFRDLGQLAPELLLMSWADVTCARGPAQPDERPGEQAQFVREMLEEYFSRGFLRCPTVPVSLVDLAAEFGVVEVELAIRLMERLTEEYIDGMFEGREDGLSRASELLETSCELW